MINNQWLAFFIAFLLTATLGNAMKIQDLLNSSDDEIGTENNFPNLSIDKTKFFLLNLYDDENLKKYLFDKLKEDLIKENIDKEVEVENYQIFINKKEQKLTRIILHKMMTFFCELHKSSDCGNTMFCRNLKEIQSSYEKLLHLEERSEEEEEEFKKLKKMVLVANRYIRTNENNRNKNTNAFSSNKRRRN